MRLISEQLVCFFGSQMNYSMDTILTSISSVLGNGLNTNIFPIPKEAPGDLPRVIVEYDSFRVQVSLTRLDVFTVPGKVNMDVLSSLWRIFVDRYRQSIKDIGYVSTNFEEIDIKKVVSSVLAKKFHDKEISELTVSVNIPCRLEYSLNSIEQIHWGEIEENGEKKQGVIVVRDMNTFIDDRTYYDLNEITSIFALMKDESMKSIFFGGL